MEPETLPLVARRNVPFIEEYAFTEDGEPFGLTGYTGTMQVRLYGAQAGDAQIALINVGVDLTEGVWISDPAGGIVQIFIYEGTLQTVYDALILGVDGGSDVELVYDLILTDSGGFQQTFLEGPFTIKPGVTV